MQFGYISSHIVERLRARGWLDTLRYAVGRFQTVRRVRRQFKRMTLLVTARSLTRAVQQPVHVEPFDPRHALRALDAESVFTGLKLQPASLAALRGAAAASTRRAHHGNRAELTADELLRNAEAPEPMLMVDYVSPALQALALEVARDPLLLATVSRFLGGPPARIETRINESLVVRADTAYRESRFQTVMFHYDVHDFGFAYVFFYLTDTDADTGAHELMRGTHKGKWLRHLLQSARQEDVEIYNCYGRDRAMVIEGPAGSGFLEDTSCFHRALVPRTGNRLALQIRYA
ncbi:hypothetical protein [Ramlibacter sp.]|uniref:hypothetical protein n=1 Tax=Ramlibacter sp. TaxID=1917967 RepID=UPI00180909CD|nr:hypothetical protein [Ramlibacter sp.]MBA2674438.1 hypothetical protein [Ramlibacter sp.]